MRTQWQHADDRQSCRRRCKSASRPTKLDELTETCWSPIGRHSRDEHTNAAVEHGCRLIARIRAAGHRLPALMSALLHSPHPVPLRSRPEDSGNGLVPSRDRAHRCRCARCRNGVVSTPAGPGATTPPPRRARPANEPFGYCLNTSTIRGNNLDIVARRQRRVEGRLSRDRAVDHGARRLHARRRHAEGPRQADRRRRAHGRKRHRLQLVSRRRRHASARRRWKS